jgi:hypothetical protein
MTNKHTKCPDIVCILQKQKAGYFVKDQLNNTRVLSDLKNYSRFEDRRTINDWYNDSKKYIRQHPLAAFTSMLSVFFGLTQF